MSEAKNTEVKGAQASAPAASPQGGENSQANTPAATAATPVATTQESENPPAATPPAADTAKTGKAKKPKSGKYVVVSPFADKDNFSKMWNEGDDVSKFDKDRLADCVTRGLVEEA